MKTGDAESLLPFDQPRYAQALRYLGDPATVAGRPLVVRAIPGSDAVDAFGPFPYGSPPRDAVAFRHALAQTGAVSWTCVMRPGTAPAAIETFDPLTIKEHFVHFRDGTPLQYSPRTRRHVRRARDAWSVGLRPLPESIDTMFHLHRVLERRAPLSWVTRVDRRHFEGLAEIEGFRCVAAALNGHDAAFLVFAESAEEIHFHLTAGDDLALRHDGMYAIFDHMLRTYSATHDLYLGGTPDGPNGEGVARFKARFANGRQPMQLARVILDPARCEQLIARFGRHRWFPPYRNPEIDRKADQAAHASNQERRSA